LATAHRSSVQSWFAPCLVLALAAACRSTRLPDTIWPPADFELVVAEQRDGPEGRQVVRRFRVRSDGLAVYGTASESLVDSSSGARLPVFTNLSVYRLVPECTRALARRVDRLGVLELDRVQGERGAVDPGTVVLSWRAFGRSSRLEARGRVHGAMAEILAVVAAHLPEGEQFAAPGVAGRGVASVLSGVPRPSADAAGALAAQAELLRAGPGDPALALDAFALACRLGRRAEAIGMLQRWTALTADERQQAEAFPDGEARLQPAILERLLPPD